MVEPAVSRPELAFKIAMDELLDLISHTVIRIRGRDGAEAALRELWAALLEVKAKVARDPGMRMAADDLYEAAAALVAARSVGPDRVDGALVRKERLIDSVLSHELGKTLCMIRFQVRAPPQITHATGRIGGPERRPAFNVLAAGCNGQRLRGFGDEVGERGAHALSIEPFGRNLPSLFFHEVGVFGVRSVNRLKHLAQPVGLDVHPGSVSSQKLVCRGVTFLITAVLPCT